jgi:hypothetical protein
MHGDVGRRYAYAKRDALNGRAFMNDRVTARGVDLARIALLQFAFNEPNRSEVVYTVGVLGDLLSRDSFAHVGAFVRLFPLSPGPWDLSDPIRTIAFQPELAPYLHAPRGHRILNDVPLGSADGALVVELADDTRLELGWEAKMFTKVRPADLRAKEPTYTAIHSVFAEAYQAYGPVQVYLVPLGLAQWLQAQGFDGPFVLWEEVYCKFREIYGEDDYSLKRLKAALDAWPRLSAHWAGPGVNGQGARLGREIVEDWQRGWTRFTWMGCAGGRGGLRRLVTSGNWQDRPFEVRYEDGPSNDTNWFPICEFIAVLRAVGVAVQDPHNN